MFATAFATFVAVFAALFPIVNPLGDGPIFLSMVQGCSREVRNKLAVSVSINSFVMLVASMVIGPQLLLFFGISLAALKLAGGAVVIAMGWNLLNQAAPSGHDTDQSTGITDATAASSAFFPLTMPLTVGPGSIATAISLVAAYSSEKGKPFVEVLPAILGALAGLIALSISIYLIYRESSAIQRLLGASGTNVLMRLFSFILLAIGVQIFLGGVTGFSVELTKHLVIN